MVTPFRFEDFFASLERVGFVDVVLPFLLIFTLIFSVLDKTKVLGEGKRNMNVGIAMIFALLVVIPHVTGNFPAGYDPVAIINAALPSVSLVVVAVVTLLILIGVFAHDRVMLGLTAPGWVGIFSVVALIFIFGSAAGWWTTDLLDWLDNVFGSDILAIAIMLLVFGMIIAFVTGGGEAERRGGTLERAGINLGELFGGRK
jgi:hypothetical protein|tara:strand:- start:2883 stop:3485 length:603 start_codon:yes stop_codon:yes gene_type:complete